LVNLLEKISTILATWNSQLQTMAVLFLVVADFLVSKPPAYIETGATTSLPPSATTTTTRPLSATTTTVQNNQNNNSSMPPKKKEISRKTVNTGKDKTKVGVKPP
jgi:hypothetical protein